MWEWLSQEWWRWVWAPILAIALPTMVTAWSRRTEQRGAAGMALDTRQERWIATQDAEITELREELRESHEEAKIWRDTAHWWHHKAHDMAQAVSSTRWVARLILKSHGYEGELPEPLRQAPIDLPPIDHPWPASKKKSEG
jgi:hypothetical protein